MNCLYCNKETNGNYNNGNFCDKHCARAFKRQQQSQSSSKEEPKEVKPRSVEESIKISTTNISTEKKKK